MWKGENQHSQYDISKATAHFERCFQKEYPTQDIYKNSISIKKLKVQGLPYVGQYSMFPKLFEKPPASSSIIITTLLANLLIADSYYTAR